MEIKNVVSTKSSATCTNVKKPVDVVFLVDASIEDEIRKAWCEKTIDKADDEQNDEHTEYTDSMAGNGVAGKLLALAKDRLAQLYTPRLAEGAAASLADVMMHSASMAAPATPRDVGCIPEEVSRVGWCCDDVNDHEQGCLQRTHSGKG